MSHKLRAFQINQAKTPTDLKKMEKQYGLRYSELFRLAYFDPIRMHVIDPMHNLLLGTAKRMFNTWVKLEIISKKKHFQKITTLQNLIKVPSGHGRIAKNIPKAYKSMKADEWKNFVFIYSMFCLKDILPKEKFEHWLLFVKACKLLCTRAIKLEDAEEARELLQQFCQGVEEIYGKKYCTANMHLHMHLAECIQDFGPVYSFWCFSFERYNGILGSYHTNNKNVGLIIMRKFCKESKIHAMDHSSYYDFTGEKETEANITNDLLLLRRRDRLQHDNNMYTKVQSAGKEVYLHDDEMTIMRNICKILYSMECLPKMRKKALKHQRLLYAGEPLAASSYLKGRNSNQYVLSHCFKNDGVKTKNLLPGIIQNFYEVKCLNGQKWKKILFAECLWLRSHPYRHEYGKECEMKIWNTLYSRNYLPFVPISFIERKYINIRRKVKFPPSIKFKRPFTQADIVNTIIPLPSKSL